MVTTLRSAASIGLTCAPITVEVDVAKAWPGFFIVGLGDTAIQEARERIRTAWSNAGLVFPHTNRIIINLAPADIRKVGTHYDLPMAIGMYVAAHTLSFDFSGCLIAGELALSGEVRPISGVLSLARYAKQEGFHTLFIPKQNAPEAALIPDLRIVPVWHFLEMVHHVDGSVPIAPVPYSSTVPPEAEYEGVDMADIRGHRVAKRAIEIAAAGGHNVLMSGPPGSGKTLLAKAIPSLLPMLTPEESIDVTTIYSIAGALPGHHPQIWKRPFRAPHHSASGAALVGGGRIPKPGEITLSHHGVLFLDELPEFSGHVLECLRQPLEDGIVHISRAHGSVVFPARFMLVASQNPCPCGFFGDDQIPCRCSAFIREKYQKKISGPLLDRLDIHIKVPRIAYQELSSTAAAEASSVVRARIIAARAVQEKRNCRADITTNAAMPPKAIAQYCELSEGGKAFLDSSVSSLHLSARAIHRILRVARTIADLETKEKISETHLIEALHFRSPEYSRAAHYRT